MLGCIWGDGRECRNLCQSQYRWNKGHLGLLGNVGAIRGVLGCIWGVTGSVVTEARSIGCIRCIWGFLGMLGVFGAIRGCIGAGKECRYSGPEGV